MKLAEINAEIEKQSARLRDLQQQAEALRNEEKTKVIEELRARIAEYGITASDLKLTIGKTVEKRALSAAKEKAAPAYRYSDGQTWSGGRGRKPKWVQDLIAAGQSLEDYRVQ